MFFPDRLKSIKREHRVLEVGPGALPHPRSDVFLERRFADDVAFEQRGQAVAVEPERPTVYYDGGRFPFDDGQFDYVIASHVLEHVPADELPAFVAELQRVAPRGYLEFPSVFYELICLPDVHRWFMHSRDGLIYMMDKAHFQGSYIQKTIRELFFNCSDAYMNRAFQRYKEFFFIGFEWQNSIDYVIVDRFDDLVNEDDFARYRTCFSSLHEPTRMRKLWTLARHRLPERLGALVGRR